MYAKIGKNTKLSIHENSSFEQSIKIDTHENEEIDGKLDSQKGHLHCKCRWPKKKNVHNMLHGNVKTALHIKNLNTRVHII